MILRESRPLPGEEACDVKADYSRDRIPLGTALVAALILHQERSFRRSMLAAPLLGDLHPVRNQLVRGSLTGGSLRELSSADAPFTLSRIDPKRIQLTRCRPHHVREGSAEASNFSRTHP